MTVRFALVVRRSALAAAGTALLVLTGQACSADGTAAFPDGEDGSISSSTSSGSGTSGGASGSGASSGSEAGASSSSGTPLPECTLPADCASGVCTAGVCQAPSNHDGVQNGTETDVDCGGGAPTNAAPCANERKCVAHSDCASQGCAYTGTCIADKSCTQHFGGDTCGRGTDVNDEPIDENLSCCARAELAGGSGVKLDRFLITAGRMRSFIEHVDGDVRSFVSGLPAQQWTQGAWNQLVPGSIVEANVMLGPRWIDAPNDPSGSTSKRSCAAPDSNGHTYFIPKAPLAVGDRTDSYDAEQQYTQEQLDGKALNCVNWYLAKAFCAWEGGRLPTHAETRNAFTNNGTTTYPWEYRVDPNYPSTYVQSATAQDPRLNHYYSYEMPGAQAAHLDMTAKISPPGRYAAGANEFGVEVAGNLLQWANDGEKKFTWTLSFEQHVSTPAMDNWGAPSVDRDDVPNGYYGLGARCAYDPQ